MATLLRNRSVGQWADTPEDRRNARAISKSPSLGRTLLGIVWVVVLFPVGLVLTLISLAIDYLTVILPIQSIPILPFLTPLLLAPVLIVVGLVIVGFEMLLVGLGLL
jgi:hypothetical protein